MQMLELTKKAHIIIAVSLAYGTQLYAQPVANASEACDPSGVTNAEIIVCANMGYSKINDILNEQYKELKSGLSDASRQSQLLDAQRAWIKFRDKSCSNVYESESPGAEAPIAKLACLGELTSVRVVELIYLRSGYRADGFATAVSAVAKPTGVDASSRTRAVKVLEGGASYSSLFDDYAEKNCSMASDLYLEEKSLCVSRMKFVNSAH
jgi:uncharacterized protein YecT (DUF1311 family)